VENRSFIFEAALKQLIKENNYPFKLYRCDGPCTYIHTEENYYSFNIVPLSDSEIKLSGTCGETLYKTFNLNDPNSIQDLNKFLAHVLKSNIKIKGYCIGTEYEI